MDSLSSRAWSSVAATVLVAMTFVARADEPRTPENIEFIRKRADPTTYTLNIEYLNTDQYDISTDQYDVSTKNRCGFSQDYEHVRRLKRYEKYSAAVKAISPRVGALSEKRYGNVYCSGILISDDLFLTASHCVEGGSQDGMEVVLNYEMGIPAGERATHRVKRVAVDGVVNGLDYAVLVIDAVNTRDMIPVATGLARDDTMVGVVQHPFGDPKTVSFGPVRRRGKWLAYAALDTARSSSGGPVFDTDGFLLGIHTTAGCSLVGGANFGLGIKTIQEDLLKQGGDLALRAAEVLN